MSALVTLREVSKSYGATPLFTGLSLTVGTGERIGLIGANGTGKSTLLKMLAGLGSPDSGERTVARMCRLSYLPQQDVFEPGRTVEQILHAALADARLSESEAHTRVGIHMGIVGFDDPDTRVDSLSGGFRKRLAIARALIAQPDVLLLDEPTNHLDLDAILWLEKLLRGLSCALVVVSHDRQFLESVCNRTVEVSPAYPGGMLEAQGPYSMFLERRSEFLSAQARLEQTLANKLRREVEWLRQGAPARTTKAKYRIDEAGRLMEELAATKARNAVGARAGIEFSATGRQTRRLLSAENISKSLGGRSLFSHLDLVLTPGLRLGLVGPNGSGKTTLLKTLSGELKPDTGHIRRAPGVNVVVFSQNRELPDPDMPLKKALSPYGDAVIYQGRELHVASYAKRFLFRPDQLEQPVGVLSGGEKARVIVARLMLEPADVLLLDEPTNDLDIPTLEVLEDSLQEFPGAVVLISHDRHLMDQVATLVVGLTDGEASLYAEARQWLAERAEAARQAAKAKTAADKPQTSREPKPKPVKLSYKEQKELDGMEAAIEAAESRLQHAQAAVADPAVASHASELSKRLLEEQAASEAVDALYARWEELNGKVESLAKK